MPSLQPVGPGIWIADGEHVSVAGFHYPTRMALVRLTGGGLFIWSPTALSSALQAEVNALGDVHFIVAPNSLHHLFIPQWQAAYPAAKTIAAPGLAARRKDIAFTAELGETPDAAWANDIDQAVVHGEPQVLQKFRVAFTDRKAARLSIRRVLDWPVQSVLMAHGPIVEKDAAAFLKRAFSWLKV